MILLAGMQGIEVRDPIDAQDDGFAIDHKPLWKPWSNMPA